MILCDGLLGVLGWMMCMVLFLLVGVFFLLLLYFVSVMVVIVIGSYMWVLLMIIR